MGKIQKIKIQELKAKGRRLFILIIMNLACRKDGSIIMGIILHITAYRQIVHISEETTVNTVV